MRPGPLSSLLWVTFSGTVFRPQEGGGGSWPGAPPSGSPLSRCFSAMKDVHSLRSSPRQARKPWGRALPEPPRCTSCSGHQCTLAATGVRGLPHPVGGAQKHRASSPHAAWLFVPLVRVPAPHSRSALTQGIRRKAELAHGQHLVKDPSALQQQLLGVRCPLRLRTPAQKPEGFSGCLPSPQQPPPWDTPLPRAREAVALCV